MISWGDIELLTVPREEADDVAPWACALAKRIGLDVSGVNELVWPNGADRFGGMIGLIEKGRVAKIRELWAPWSSGTLVQSSDNLPYLNFYDAPTPRMRLAALEPVDADANAGYWFVALTDVRWALQHTLFSNKNAPEIAVDWPTAVSSLLGSIPTANASVELTSTSGISSASGRLKPEVDDPHVLDLTVGQWLEAAAYSVGVRWHLRADGGLNPDSSTAALALETTNRDNFERYLIDGRFDEPPANPIARVNLLVREAYGAVPWPRGTERFTALSATASTGYFWEPETTALWERSPVTGESQENSAELQTLADALLADVEAWHATEFKVRLAGLVNWQPGPRDKCVRWISRDDTPEGCCTIVESLRMEDLPKRLIHRSSCAPREGSIHYANVISDGVVELPAAVGRPAYKVHVTGHEIGCTPCAGQGALVDYNRSGGYWIRLPVYPSPATCPECTPSDDGSDSFSTPSFSFSTPSDDPSDGDSTPPSDSTPSDSTPSGSGSASTPSGSASTPSGSASTPPSGSASAGSSAGGGSSTDGSGSILPDGGCCAEGDAMITTYVFQWTSTTPNIGGGGIQIVWNGTIWVGSDTLQVPDGEGGFTPCYVEVQMSCDGPAFFTVLVNASSDSDTSAGGECNPLLLSFAGTFDAGCLVFNGCSVTA